MDILNCSQALISVTIKNCPINRVRKSALLRSVFDKRSLFANDRTGRFDGRRAKQIGLTRVLYRSDVRDLQCLVAIGSVIMS